MVGEGPYRKKLEALSVNLALKNSITFIGRIQYADLPSYICVGDLFAMPSRSRLAGLEVEGLGIVYLEASACGLPVIAGKSGGAPDAVLEGVTGATVDGRNSSDIARAAIALLDDLGEARAMGARGREWVISNWRWEIWAKEFGKLFRIN
jgi:phosphatidylinositol alpha-1,6-mannosyltransferase